MTTDPDNKKNRMLGKESGTPEFTLATRLSQSQDPWLSVTFLIKGSALSGA